MFDASKAVTLGWDGRPLIILLGSVEIHAETANGHIHVSLHHRAKGTEPIGEILCTEDGLPPVKAA